MVPVTKPRPKRRFPGKAPAGAVVSAHTHPGPAILYVLRGDAEVESDGRASFYGPGGTELKMGNLFKRVIEREMADGTYHRYNPRRQRSFEKVKADA